MLILNMLLRITGFTQEQLANEVGLTRASINAWLSDDSSMSLNSKQKIADRFRFPVSYFDYDINQDKTLFKSIYESINYQWKLENHSNNSKVDQINNLLNDIEAELPEEQISNNDIMEGLINGYNPFTGEIFEDNHILLDPRVKRALQKSFGRQKFGVTNVKKDDLDPIERDLFERLRIWRLDKRDEEGYYNAYVVFNDRELINIVKAEINNKEDLLNIRGIGYTKYKKYADELFEIINEWKEDNSDDDYEDITLRDSDLPF